MSAFLLAVLLNLSVIPERIGPFESGGYQATSALSIDNIAKSAFVTGGGIGGVLILKNTIEIEFLLRFRPVMLLVGKGGYFVPAASYR